MVNVLATVHDKQHKIVKNLEKDDFQLEEDGKSVPIQYFSRETNLPLTLGLLVDTSGSQRRVLGEEREAAARFLDRVLREDTDMAFVIHFDREVELSQDLTASRKQLRAAIAHLEVPEFQPRPRDAGGYPPQGGRRMGGTMLYDSVLLGADEILRKQHGRKAMILLTDGVDNGSKVSITAAIDAAQKADTLVYSILFADDEAYTSMGRPGGHMGGRHGGMGGGRPMPQMQQRPDGKKVLQRISQETGGSFYVVSKKRPLDEIFTDLQEELRNQYSLGFLPPAGASGFRRIQVTARDRSMIVQTRSGYYAAESR